MLHESQIPAHLLKYFVEVPIDKRLVKPCVVADVFSGAGTVAKVAVSKNRHFIGIELNPKYAELSRKRINKAIMNRGFGL